MSSTVILAVLSCVLIAIPAAFHFYWGLGGKTGLGVSLPQMENGQPVMKHSSIAAHFVGIALSSAIVCILGYVDVIPLPLPKILLKVGVGIIAIVFAGRALSWYKYAGFFKKVHNTAFAKYDTWLYNPICLAVGIGLMLVLIGD